MKFTTIISTLALAMSVAALPAAVTETTGIDPVEDSNNYKCNLKKRDAEAAGRIARDLADKYNKAREVRDSLLAGTMTAIEAREAFPVPGCIKLRGNEVEDGNNGCCLKLKREAEAAADAAVKAYVDFATALKSTE